jgi:ABC-type branched-subunit amino acid transport system ATPase component
MGLALSGLPPYEVARLGVKYVPQDKKVFLGPDRAREP